MPLGRAPQLLGVLLTLLAGSCECQALPRWWAGPAASPPPRSLAAALPPMLPLQACSVLAAFASSPNATVTFAAARAAGMGEQLNDASSPATFFVPTDRAWVLLCAAMHFCRDPIVCALDSCRDQLLARPQDLATTLQASRALALLVSFAPSHNSQLAVQAALGYSVSSKQDSQAFPSHFSSPLACDCSTSWCQARPSRWPRCASCPT